MFVSIILGLVVFINDITCLAPPLTDEEKSYLHEDDKIQLPLTIQHRVSFKSRYVDHRGHIYTRKPSSPTVIVQATTHVSDIALMKAAQTVAHMVRHTPSDVFMGVTRSHGVGIFTKQESLTVFPENHHLADTAACHNKCDGSCKHTCTFDGRKYQEIAGVTNSRSVALDSTVLCNSHDPYRHKLNVVSHEFAHLLHRYMPSSYRNRISYAYNNAKQHHTWTTSYATATVNEYFAEATTAFFMTTASTKNAGGMDLCNHMTSVCVNEMVARDHLKHQDPELYDILQKVYTNGHPSTPSGLKTCICNSGILQLPLLSSLWSTVCVNEMDARDHLKRQDPELFDILQKIYTNDQPLTPSGLKQCMTEIKTIKSSTKIFFVIRNKPNIYKEW